MMDLISFPDQARLWVYGASKPIADSQIPILYREILQFTQRWTSHNRAVKATGGVLHNYFVVLLADERFTQLSGCSIDDSVHFIRQLGEKYNTEFFDRKTLHYLMGDSVQTIGLSQIGGAIREGIVDKDTLFFDPLVNTKGDFLRSWVKPLGESWIMKLVY